ncbi:hypothetical protein V5F77_06150 [Xanthobacter sp. DSM 24535]|uniref:hypothetical protein n=1 Tax=Roseixanthobacter psychrophilus TaxID=3119917 RepID=UPI003727BD19
MADNGLLPVPDIDGRRPVLRTSAAIPKSETEIRAVLRVAAVRRSTSFSRVVLEENH